MGFVVARFGIGGAGIESSQGLFLDLNSNAALTLETSNALDI